MSVLRRGWLRALFLAPLLLAACGDDSVRELEVPDLVVGVVWPSDPEAGLLVEGVQLAIEEINAAGGVLGRQVRMAWVDDLGDGTTRDGSRIAHEMVGQEGLALVVGHVNPRAALMASVAYNRADVLYLNVAITDRSITKGGFSQVFSLIANNDRLGAQLATLADSLGQKRVAMLSSRDDWAFQVAEAFVQQASVLGITIPVRRSFYPGRASYLGLIAELGADEFDTILVISDQDSFEAIAAQTYSTRIGKPLLAGNMLNPVRVNEHLEGQSDSLIIPVLLDPESTREEVVEFRAKFLARFGEEPDSVAAQGYDAVNLFATTARDTGSETALSVATVLRYSTAWNGVTGLHSFDRRGRIYSKPFGFAQLEQGRIQFLGDG